MSDFETAATLFSGGGGSDIGLSQAGLDVRWGIEYDDEIASVARENGLNVYTRDVTEEDPSDYEQVDFLHASPPCPNFSVAKANAEETDEDVSLARATANFIDQLEPRGFTLENVWGYRKSKSWSIISKELKKFGYNVSTDKINFAEWGVPQNRKRMIVIACKNPSFPNTKEKIGWYQEIENVIDKLPEDQLAKWQNKRLPKDIGDGVLCQGDGGIPTWPKTYEPAQTIGTNEGLNVYRAVFPPKKVVRITIEAVAKLQTFPDWYNFPSSKSLSWKIIGNAMPPRAMKTLAEHIIRSTS